MNDFAFGFITDYGPALIIGSILLVILIFFSTQFFIPARRLRKDLADALKALNDIKNRSDGKVVELGEVEREVMGNTRLAYLWHEYAKTLHPQKEKDSLGQIRIVRWRATALAESFFSEQALVDIPLKTEFYKHLPGILTGVGIIGTFSGLILGLSKFHVSSVSEEAQNALNELIKSVYHAFIMSAFAIFLAMVFTWIEKSLVTKRYKQVEDLRQLIDSLFDAGVGEEYLDRLVKASETSATQAAQIKDALVTDLKQILIDIAEKQIEASARQTGQIGVDIGKAIAEHLGAPIEKISNAVDRVGANQGDAVNKMLTDVLSSFSAQMQDMFGGQMRGMTELLQQTSQAMQVAVSKFDQLAANMDSAGKGAVDAMGERLNQAMTSIEARQQILNRQMEEFVAQIKTMVSESQTQASQKLQETLAKLGEQVTGIVGQLQEQTRIAAASQQEQTERVATQTGEVVSRLSEQMETLIAQSIETSRSLQASVVSLSKTTQDAITGMNAGAETLFLAASDFAKAGQGVTETMKASSIATEKIQQAAQALNIATSATQQVLQDYGKTRDVFGQMVTDLKLTIETAKREASMTSELINGLQRASNQLEAAQKLSEEYLQGVNKVLTEAHKIFAENIERTLRQGNSQFHQELSQAVSLLSGSIKNLGDMLDELPAKR